MTLVELQAERDRILSRMARGVTEAGSGADRVAFQGADKDRIALDIIDKEIASLSSNSRASKGRFTACDR